MLWNTRTCLHNSAEVQHTLYMKNNCLKLSHLEELAGNNVCMIPSHVSGHGVMEVQRVSQRLLVVMVDHVRDRHGGRWCGNWCRGCTTIKASCLAQLRLHTFGNVCLGMLVEMVFAGECFAAFNTRVALAS